MAAGKKLSHMVQFYLLNINHNMVVKVRMFLQEQILDYKHGFKNNIQPTAQRTYAFPNRLCYILLFHSSEI